MLKLLNILFLANIFSSYLAEYYDKRQNRFIIILCSYIRNEQ